MALIFESWTADFLSMVVAILASAIITLQWCFTYWQRQGIFSPPTSFPFGHSKKIFTQKESFSDFTERYYKYFRGKNLRYGGLYTFNMASYMPIEPRIVQSILQNDFDHFVDRGMYFNEADDPLSAHLFSLEGNKWRNLRVKLTPTFTSGKMKMMFATAVKCGEELLKVLEKDVSEPMDVKDVLGRFTTDVIGSCAFGIDCNSLQNPDNEYTKHFQLFFQRTFWENIGNFFAFLFPNFARKCHVKLVNSTLSKFFMGLLREMIDYREKHNVYRKDFMHLLLQLKNRGRLVDDEQIFENDPADQMEHHLSFEEVAAQAFIFFSAGYETSSTTLTFCLFELALNQSIQDKLREEIEEVLERHQGNICYDAMMEMHYMDKVVNETLRKYPPVPFLRRVCNKEYTIPDTKITLDKGVVAFIPIIGLHKDPEYYPEPDKFIPERFDEEEKKKRPHCTFLPFGDGPRNCIGLRFGLMQTKIGLSFLVKNYKFSLNPKTTVPLRLSPKSLVLTPEGGIWLDYRPV